MPLRQSKKVIVKVAAQKTEAYNGQLKDNQIAIINKLTENKPEEDRSGFLGVAEPIKAVLEIIALVSIGIFIGILASSLSECRDRSDESVTK